jgi:hypothetical protein
MRAAIDDLGVRRGVRSGDPLPAGWKWADEVEPEPKPKAKPKARARKVSKRA